MKSKRVSIELATHDSDFQGLQEMSETLADDALAGRCGEDTYWVAMMDFPDLRYAWASTCLMYFDHQMSEAQQDRAKQELIDSVTAELD